MATLAEYVWLFGDGFNHYKLEILRYLEICMLLRIFSSIFARFAAPKIWVI